MSNVGFVILAAAWVAASTAITARADLVESHGIAEDDCVIDVDLEIIANHGVMAGTADEPLVFNADTRVTGSGYFEYTLSLGTFSPGNSPGVTTGFNQAFGGTIQFELGGTAPGFGSNNHDQINDTGTISLFNPTLSILPFGGFVPQPGDQFKILTWQTGLSGSFGATLIDSFFTNANITFVQVIDNVSGPGSLTLVAQAIPEASPLMTCGGLAAIAVGIAAHRRIRGAANGCNRRPGATSPIK
jgi:hypothetical protein